MAKSLIVTSTAYETRAALLEDGLVVEVFVERLRERGIAGNIYKGRVKKVLPGMQSAFVDVGLEKDAFLYVSDVVDDSERWLGENTGEDEPARGGINAEAADGTAVADVEPAPGSSTIEQLLTEGQEILVQVAKEPMAGKGARITAHVSLPGRYLVYMPGVRHVGVSRRIEVPDERNRLKEIVERLRDAGEGGFIVRTAGGGREGAEIELDAAYLRELWSTLRAKADGLRPPRVVHCELVLLDKLLRDLVLGDFSEIVVDTVADYQSCVEFLARLEPAGGVRVKLHSQRTALFEVYGIESAIERALRSKVWLKSGGYLVINQTEALVAIDVNTGRFVGKSTLEDTAFRTNLEAVKEVVRQIRLRDLGGIVVVDFIDMTDLQNRERVVAELELGLRSNRSRTKILNISDFGLVEMTRKRVKKSLERQLCQPCPQCGGAGRVRSPETLVYEIHRELMKARDSLAEGTTLELRVHPEVATVLAGRLSGVLVDLERELGRRVVVKPDSNLHMEHYDFLPAES